MHFLKSLLFLFSLPLYLSSSSNYDLACHVIDNVSKKFYSVSVSSIITDHEELLELVTFVEDLAPLLKSALIGNPDMTPSEMSAVVLNNLKYKLSEIGQWGSASGQKFYAIFLDHFSRKYEEMSEVHVATDAAAPSSSNSINYIPDESELMEYLEDDLKQSDGALKLNDTFTDQDFHEFCADISSTRVTEKYSSSGNISGSKRSNSNIKKDDEKIWKMAILKLELFPCKIFEFSRTIQDDDISLAFISASDIYEHLLVTFQEYITKSTPYSAETIRSDFNHEVLTFLETMTGIFDEETKDRFAIYVSQFIKELVAEIGASFKEDSEEELEEEFFRNSKRGKTSPERSPIENQERPEKFLPEDLEIPENKKILDDPLETIQYMCIDRDSEMCIDVRGLYLGLMENDFPDMEKNLLKFLQNVTDNSIIDAYRL